MSILSSTGVLVPVVLVLLLSTGCHRGREAPSSAGSSEVTLPTSSNGANGEPATEPKGDVAMDPGRYGRFVLGQPLKEGADLEREPTRETMATQRVYRVKVPNERYLNEQPKEVRLVTDQGRISRLNLDFAPADRTATLHVTLLSLLGSAPEHVVLESDPPQDQYTWSNERLTAMLVYPTRYGEDGKEVGTGRSLQLAPR